MRADASIPAVIDPSLCWHSIGGPVGRLCGGSVDGSRVRGGLLVSSLVLVLEPHVILCTEMESVHHLAKYVRGRVARELTLDDGIAVVNSKGTNIRHGLDLGRTEQEIRLVSASLSGSFVHCRIRTPP